MTIRTVKRNIAYRIGQVIGATILMTAAVVVLLASTAVVYGMFMLLAAL